MATKVIIRADLPGMEKLIEQTWDGVLGAIETKVKQDFAFDFYVAQSDQQCYLVFTFNTLQAANEFRQNGIAWLAQTGWVLSHAFLFEAGTDVPIHAKVKISR